MRVLITGITGFVGSHMADYLIENVSNVEVFGLRKWRSRYDDVKQLYKFPNVTFIEGDITDRSSLYRAIQISKPDIVFHFAAQSFPGSSFVTPISTLTTNVIGTTNLLEELRIAKENNFCDPVIISVSSSEVYGMPKEDEIPINEFNPIRAANPYSISKVGHDLMSQYYASAYDMKIIITRMFSHEGKRRGKMFALSSFAHQIVRHEKKKDFGKEGSWYEIYHGNLDSVRTYNHVEDAVHGYWLAATKATYGEVYVIGGTKTNSVGEALDMLISKSKKPEVFIKLLDPERVRPTDITLQVPDSSKFREETGWNPTKGLSEICDDLLDYWRDQM